MMKKLFSLSLLICSVALLVCGCGSNTNSQGNHPHQLTEQASQSNKSEQVSPQTSTSTPEQMESSPSPVDLEKEKLKTEEEKRLAEEAQKRANAENAAKANKALLNGAILSRHASIKYNRVRKGMPKNARQVPGMYWIGTRPDEESIPVMLENEIGLVVSASRMTTTDLKKLEAMLKKAGIETLHIPYGSKFPNPSRFLDTLHQYDPDEIYVFCDHGADRSGGMIAWLLVTEHGYTIPQALYSIVYPTGMDIRGIERILKERGIDAPSKDYEEWIGIYSSQKNGGIGGFKCHAEKYFNFTNSLIDSMIEHGKQNNDSTGEQ